MPRTFFVQRSVLDTATRVVTNYLRSTSKRTFVAIPIVIGLIQLVSRRPVRGRGLPLMLWGYFQYRLCGRYRTKFGGGGPGVSGPPPEELVTAGPYRFMRNPMYAGHLIFLGGVALSSDSPLSWMVAVGFVPWFRRRVIEDEARLSELFGTDYERYRQEVGRWGPRPQFLRREIAEVRTRTH